MLEGSKWVGCHIVFSSLAIMAIIDPLQKLSCLSSTSVVGWFVCFFPLQGCQMQDGTARFLMIITQSVISANIPPRPLATEMNSGCISPPVSFQLVKSGFSDISWVMCSVLQQDYTCAAVKCEIRAEQDLPWEAQAINRKSFKWRARRKRLALG